MKLSIIIPAHNEENRISKTLEEYCRFFSKKCKKEFEIIVVLNGCTDRTLDIVRRFKRKYSQIKYLNFMQSGKGFAIIQGFKAARGELIGFTDADCSTPPEAFYDLIENINGFGGIIANRWMKESIVRPKQPLSRRMASRIFNLLVRALFGIKSQDTQCGAKLFKKEAIKKVLPNIGITAWAFDIDLLYQLKKKGYKIKDIPTVWSDKGHSKLNVAKTSFQMFLAVVRLRLINSPFKFVVRAYDLLPENIKIYHKLSKK
jgi:glycosyltransferase involved in cell wall biosynthesis